MSKRITLFLIGIVFLAGCTQTGKIVETKQALTFTDDNFNVVTSDPDSYKGDSVNITGELLQDSQIYSTNGNNYVNFQMNQGGKNIVGQNVAVSTYDTSKSQLKTGDCVRVIGLIGGKYTGQNAFGANIQSVLISSDKINKTDCKNILYPNINVSFLNATKTFSIGQSNVAKPSYRYIVVNFVIQNYGDKQIFVSSSNAILLDSDGNQYQDDFATYSLNNYFQSQNLLPNSQESGGIAFQVPEKANITQFIYELDNYNNVLIKFNTTKFYDS